MFFCAAQSDTKYIEVENTLTPETQLSVGFVFLAMSALLTSFIVWVLMTIFSEFLFKKTDLRFQPTEKADLLEDRLIEINNAAHKFLIKLLGYSSALSLVISSIVYIFVYMAFRSLLNIEISNSPLFFMYLCSFQVAFMILETYTTYYCVEATNPTHNASYVYAVWYNTLVGPQGHYKKQDDLTVKQKIQYILNDKLLITLACALVLVFTYTICIHIEMPCIWIPVSVLIIIIGVSSLLMIFNVISYPMNIEKYKMCFYFATGQYQPLYNNKEKLDIYQKIIFILRPFWIICLLISLRIGQWYEWAKSAWREHLARDLHKINVKI
jgi:hypothetical protein